MQLRKREHIQLVRACAQPTIGCSLNGFGSSRFKAIQRGRIETRIAGIDGILCQDVRLAAKTADSFHAAHKTGLQLRLDSSKFIFGQAFCKESLHFLVDRLPDRLDVATRLYCGLQLVIAADLSAEQASTHAGGSLVFVNEPLIQSRILTTRQHGISKLEEVRVF